MYRTHAADPRDRPERRTHAATHAHSEGQRILTNAADVRNAGSADCRAPDIDPVANLDSHSILAELDATRVVLPDKRQDRGRGRRAVMREHCELRLDLLEHLSGFSRIGVVVGNRARLSASLESAGNPFVGWTVKRGIIL